MKEEIEIYANGFVSCSVCTNIKDKKRIEELVNQKNPTGISSQWSLAEEKTWADGKPQPSPCENKPKTHMHYLLHC